MPATLVDAISEICEDNVILPTRQISVDGTDHVAMLDAGRAAMAIARKRFQAGEYSLPELLLSGEMQKKTAAFVKPHLRMIASSKRRTHVIIGTTEGDLQDIGND